MSQTTYNTFPSRSSFKAFLVAGLIVGTLDILSAFVDYAIATGGKNPVQILRYVASGMFGPSALTGGTGMALLGLLFHYIAAFSFTAFFFWLYPRFNLLAKNRVITGIVYGMFVWAIMNLIVVPLSNTTKAPFKIARVIKGMLILICMIGIPLSYLAYRFFYGNKKMNETQARLS